MTGCCKGTPYMDRVSVYLPNVGESNRGNISNALVNVLGYTQRQASTAINFANSRGECLVFEGSQTEAVDNMKKLSMMGVHCSARSRKNIK
jgi:hypothetical protein